MGHPDIQGIQTNVDFASGQPCELGHMAMFPWAPEKKITDLRLYLLFIKH